MASFCCWDLHHTYLMLVLRRAVVAGHGVDHMALIAGTLLLTLNSLWSRGDKG